jgi:type II secretory pathway pseudopilin PulG
MDTRHKQLTAPHSCGAGVVRPWSLGFYAQPGSPAIGPQGRAATPPASQAPAASAIRHQSSALGRAAAFTLIESVVAIGIFAFVIVGIVGLFGSTLERQRQASFETRAVLMAQQITARFATAASLTNLSLITGEDSNTRATLYTNFDILPANSAATSAFTVYYQQDGTAAGYMELNSNNYASDFIPTDISNVSAKALVTVNQEPGNPGLFRMNFEVSEPANLPTNARKKQTFSTFFAFPQDAL